MARVSTNYGDFHRKLPQMSEAAMSWRSTPDDATSRRFPPQWSCDVNVAINVEVPTSESAMPMVSNQGHIISSCASGASTVPEKSDAEALGQHPFVGSVPLPPGRSVAHLQSLSPSPVEELSAVSPERPEEIRINQLRSETARIRGCRASQNRVSFQNAELQDKVREESKQTENAECQQIQRRIEELKAENERLKSIDPAIGGEIIQQARDVARTHESAIRNTKLQLEILSRQLDQQSSLLESYEMHERCVDADLEQLRVQEALLRQQLKDVREAKLFEEKPVGLSDGDKKTGEERLICDSIVALATEANEDKSLKVANMAAMYNEPMYSNAAYVQVQFKEVMPSTTSSTRSTLASSTTSSTRSLPPGEGSELKPLTGEQKSVPVNARSLLTA